MGWDDRGRPLGMWQFAWAVAHGLPRRTFQNHPSYFFSDDLLGADAAVQGAGEIPRTSGPGIVQQAGAAQRAATPRRVNSGTVGQ